MRYKESFVVSVGDDRAEVWHNIKVNQRGVVDMNWKLVTIPEGSKLFKSHGFTFIHKGATYLLEVDEHRDGSFTGHGEHTTDKSNVLASVHSQSMEDCLNQLISKIKK